MRQLDLHQRCEKRWNVLSESHLLCDRGRKPRVEWSGMSAKLSREECSQTSTSKAERGPPWLYCIAMGLLSITAWEQEKTHPLMIGWHWASENTGPQEPSPASLSAVRAWSPVLQVPLRRELRIDLFLDVLSLGRAPLSLGQLACSLTCSHNALYCCSHHTCHVGWWLLISVYPPLTCKYNDTRDWVYLRSPTTQHTVPGTYSVLSVCVCVYILVYAHVLNEAKTLLQILALPLTCTHWLPASPSFLPSPFPLPIPKLRSS